MKNQIQAFFNENRFAILLAICLLIVYIVGFFNPVRGDAVRYAAIGQEMFHNNNFLELQNRGGVPYLQKPPLLFWIINLSYHIFGINHFAYKMPVFLISLLGVYATYRNALLSYNRKIATLTCIFLIVSFGMIFYQNDIHTDSIILTTVMLSIWQLNLFLRNNKFKHLILGFFFIGLSMMTKGPIGLAIPIFAFAIDTLLKRNWKNIFRWEWLIGIVIIAITISPALIGLYKQFGNEGLAFYFWSNQTDRITGALRVNSTDHFFYVHTILWEFLPWSIFIIYGIFHELRKIVKTRFKLSLSEEALNIGGIFIFFAIISASKFKGPNYLIPLFPFFAAISAKWAIHLYDSAKGNALKFVTIVQYLAFAGIWIITIYFTVLNINDISIYILLFIIVLLITFVLGLIFLKSKLSKIVVGGSAVIIAFGMLFNGFVVPLTFEYHSMLQACNIVNKQTDASTKFIMLNTEEVEFSDDTFNFYLSPEPTYTNDVNQIKQLSDYWVFADAEDYELLLAENINFSKVHKLSHLKNIKPGFLNPKTRQQSLKYFYLLRI